MSVLDYMEKPAQYAQEQFGDQMAGARDPYFHALGIMHETDELYEETMKAYLDWFLFERPVEKEGLTPIRLFVDRVVPGLKEDEAEIYRGFAFYGKRSLFQIRRIHAGVVECRDLFSRETTRIAEDVTSGFLKDEIFEGRVLPFQGVWRFGDMLRFHPARANGTIIKAAKALGDCAGEAAKNLMTKLAVCKVKHHLFPRIDLLQFYGEILK